MKPSFLPRQREPCLSTEPKFQKPKIHPLSLRVLLLILTCRLPAFQDCCGNQNPRGRRIKPRSPCGSVSPHFPQPHLTPRSAPPVRRQKEGAGKSHSPAPRPHMIAGLFLKRYQSLHKGLGKVGPSSHGASLKAGKKETAPSQSQFLGLSRLSLNK